MQSALIFGLEKFVGCLFSAEFTFAQRCISLSEYILSDIVENKVGVFVAPSF